MDIDEYSAWAGAQSTLNNLLDHWSDYGDVNRLMVEMLLAQAILKTAELEE